MKDPGALVRQQWNLSRSAFGGVFELFMHEQQVNCSLVYACVRIRFGAGLTAKAPKQSYFRNTKPPLESLELITMSGERISEKTDAIALRGMVVKVIFENRLSEHISEKKHVSVGVRTKTFLEKKTLLFSSRRVVQTVDNAIHRG